MTKCLIAEYETRAAAKVALETLEACHFTLANVSIVSDASDPAAEHLHGLRDEAESDWQSAAAPEGRSTSLGMLIGGSVAAPIAAGTMIGPFIVVGPLVGMAIGAAVGKLLGSMEHWGVAHDVSADYETRVKSGSVLVIVHDLEETRLTDANALLAGTDPVTLESYESARPR